MSSRFGHGIRNAGVADLSLRAHQALRHRRGGHDKRARDLVGFEAAQRSKRQRNLCLGASAGWQQVKISRRRSSGISVASKSGSGVAAIVPDAATGLIFSSKCRRRLMRSMALCRAVWMIHARGESGTPEVRH